MSGQSKKKRADEVFERLDKLTRSQVVGAAREFRHAGLTTEVGRCYFHTGARNFQSIELVASNTSNHPSFHLTISWHIAIAPGKSDLLVVVTGTGEKGEENQSVSGFRPLTNVEGQALLPLMRQPYTGISLFDAPRILGRCLEDSLKPKGLDSHSNRAMRRALNSAYQATLMPASSAAETAALPHYKIAIPVLISPTDLFEANLAEDGVESDDSCFVAVEIGDNTQRINQPLLDIISPSFLGTYAKMAAETTERLPQLIDQHLSGEKAEPPPTLEAWDLRPGRGKKSQIDAWEEFREL
jgi:hypothetical protein